MFAFTRETSETAELAQPVELTAEELTAVAGGKNVTPVGPAPYNVHSSPAGAGPAFYNQ
jgi:hypothetical protein